MSRSVAGVIMVGVAVVALSVAVSARAAEDVHIGFLGALTGPAASYGQDAISGVRMAVEEINAKNGIAGRKLVIDDGDDRGDPKEAANVAQRFVADRNVVAMIGGVTSTATFGATAVAQRDKLPFLITLASHPDLTKEGNYIFRNSITQEFEGPRIADLMRVCLGAKNVAIMNLNNDWGVAMTENFIKGFEAGGGRILVRETYNPGENVDYSSKLLKLKSAKPDAIFFGSQYDDLALILKQAQRVDLGVPLMASAGDHSTGLLQVAGAAADGLHLHTTFFTDNPKANVQRFVKAFTAKFHKQPNLFSAQAYDSVFILADAIAKGGFDRQKTRDALAATKEFDGVTGAVTFDPTTREAVGRKTVPLVVKNGQFTLWSDCAKKAGS
jgi:branched-chain amino acid transport system substrate-binding protein